MSRRSRAYIYFDVLEAIWNGIDVPTRITYEINLSREEGYRVFDTLIRSGFIWEKKEKESVRYNLTTKGRNVSSYYWKALENLVYSEVIFLDIKPVRNTNVFLRYKRLRKTLKTQFISFLCVSFMYIPPFYFIFLVVLLFIRYMHNKTRAIACVYHISCMRSEW